MTTDEEMSKRRLRRRLGWGVFAGCWIVFLLLAVFRGDAMAPIHNAEKAIKAHGRFARHERHVPPGPGANFALVRWYDRLMAKLAPDYVQRRTLDNCYYNIEITDPKADDELLEALQDLPAVHFLGIQTGNYSGEGISHIAALPELTRLALDVSDRTADDFARIAEIDNLTSLKMTGRLMAPEALSLIGQIGDLKHLEIRDPVSSNKELSRLGNLAELVSLSLTLSADADQLSVLLDDMNQLKSLTLRRSGTGEIDLSALESLPLLESLHLTGNGFTDESIRNVTGMSALTSLNLSNTLVEDGFAELLARSPNLSDVNLLGSQVGNRTLLLVANLISSGHDSRLQSLNLTETNVTGDGLVHIVGLPITVLCINDCSDISAAVGSLGQMPQLKWLSVARTNLQVDDLKQLRTLPNLRFLSVSGTDVGRDGFREIAMFSRVTELDLRDTNVSRSDLECIMKKYRDRALATPCHIRVNVEESLELSLDEIRNLEQRYPGFQLW